jgi:peptidoglycan/LPS O-acetylase OafA/YrhL
VIKSAEADEVFYVPASMASSTMANSTSSVSAKVPRTMAGISLTLTKIPDGRPEIAMNKTIYPLTSVRFFAASLVLIHHSVGIFLPASSTKEAHLARCNIVGILSLPIAVSFFFLLSGYVLSYVYLHDGQTVDKSKFFAARLARLYPLYFVMLILDTPKLLAGEIERHGMKLGLAMTGEIFAASMGLLQVWYPIKLAKINPPGWSLCVEAFFCLCFPVLGVLLWKLRGVQLCMTALLLYVGGQALVWWMRVRLGIGMTVTLPPAHLSTFALGILLARWQTLRRMQTDRPQVQAWHVNTVLWLAVGGILLSVWLVPVWQIPNPYFNGLLAPIYAAFIWALSVMPTLWSRWLCRKWMVALGNASYALYLIHYPILNLFVHFRWVTPVCYLVYLGLCLAISLLSHRYFETPVRLWLLERALPSGRISDSGGSTFSKRRVPSLSANKTMALSGSACLEVQIKPSTSGFCS